MDITNIICTARNGAGVGKVRPTGHIRPSETFCPARGVAFAIHATNSFYKNMNICSCSLKSMALSAPRNFKTARRLKKIATPGVDRKLCKVIVVGAGFCALWRKKVGCISILFSAFLFGRKEHENWIASNKFAYDETNSCDKYIPERGTI
jgi:hypothetical protein